MILELRARVPSIAAPALLSLAATAGGGALGALVRAERGGGLGPAVAVRK